MAIAIAFASFFLVPFLTAVECPTPCCDEPVASVASASDDCCASDEQPCEMQRSESRDRCGDLSCCDVSDTALISAQPQPVRNGAHFVALLSDVLTHGDGWTAADSEVTEVSSRPPGSGLRVHLRHCVILR